jgi:hypothetical protein
VLCHFQQFNESAFHNLRLGFCGLSNFIQGHLYKASCNFVKPKLTSIRCSEIFGGSSIAVCSKLHTFGPIWQDGVFREGDECRTVTRPPISSPRVEGTGRSALRNEVRQFLAGGIEGDVGHARN